MKADEFVFLGGLFREGDEVIFARDYNKSEW